MVQKDVTVYKPQLSVIGGGLVAIAILFFGLTLPLIVEGAPVETKKLLALVGLWLIGIAVTILPFGNKLEIGGDYIKMHMFGFATTPKIRCSDIQVIDYGNVFRGGLGYGKGINFRVGERGKAYSIAEAIYGKEAVAHAKRVLEKDKTQS